MRQLTGLDTVIPEPAAPAPAASSEPAKPTGADTTTDAVVDAATGRTTDATDSQKDA